MGQWRPQVDANAVPQILTDVRSPLPSEDFLGWKQPQYYSTIQTANLDGQPGVEVIARFPDGMRAYGYTPPAGGNSIDGGTWSTLATDGPFTDDKGWTRPPALPDDQVRRCRGPLSPRVALTATGWTTLRVGTGFGTTDAGTVFPTGQCSDPACYTSLRVLPGDGVRGWCWPIPGTRWARASWPSGVPDAAAPVD